MRIQKRIFLLAGLLLAVLSVSGWKASAAEEVEIDVINFPDPNFRGYVSSVFDTDGNGWLSEEEIAEAESIDLRPDEMVGIGSITSLKGVEYLTALEYLDCGSNQVTELDVSRNTALKELNCSSNSLSQLDVSRNTALKKLLCYSNHLTELDVSRNTALEILECSFNELTELKVRNNTALESLWCWSNELTELDVSQNIALETVGF